MFEYVIPNHNIRSFINIKCHVNTEYVTFHGIQTLRFYVNFYICYIDFPTETTVQITHDFFLVLLSLVAI